MPQSQGPLVREVEFPRRQAGVWGPILALVAAVMVTVMTGIAVTARHPRRVRAERPQILDHRAAPAVTPVIAPVAPAVTIEECGKPVWRANADGRPELYEDCAAYVTR